MVKPHHLPPQRVNPQGAGTVWNTARRGIQSTLVIVQPALCHFLRVGKPPKRWESLENSSARVFPALACKSSAYRIEEKLSETGCGLLNRWIGVSRLWGRTTFLCHPFSFFRLTSSPPITQSPLSVPRSSTSLTPPSFLMSDILNKQLTLKLNSRWIGVGFVTIRQAVTFLCSEQDGEHPGFALDIEMAVDENGNSTLVYANPTKWEDWLKLPVRESDLAITTGRGQIRAPLVVVCANYSKIPTRTTR
jgi:hypothetical protein